MALYIYGTSRANGLKEHVNVPVHHYPGKQFEFIVDKAFNDLKHYDGKKLLYLMAGIPDVINKLEEKNVLKLNQDKTELIVFAPKHRIKHLSEFSLSFNGTTSIVNDVSCVKNLGVFMDKTLSMEQQVRADKIIFPPNSEYWQN